MLSKKDIEANTFCTKNNLDRDILDNWFGGASTNNILSLKKSETQLKRFLDFQNK